jgi:hypothetical protein
MKRRHVEEPRSNDNPAYPPELEDAEARLIAERRAQVRAVREESLPGPRTLPDDAIGFGLSGGGIRSATFSLGILQALARVQRLRDIDFLSTVSGGGYVGAFLGRLYTREWIRNPEDVERVLLSQDAAGASSGLGARVCRWLRDNGRYLAPRGSGDLLLLASIALRNWLAVQLVLVTFALTLFLLLHVVRGGLDGLLAGLPFASAVTYFLTCAMPGGDGILWWSSWLLVATLVLSTWVVPAGWAYFLVGRDRTGPRGLHPIIGAALVLSVATAGMIHYAGALQARDDRLARFMICAVVGVLGGFALIWLAAGRWRSRRDKDGDRDGIARNVLSRWLTTGLVAAGALLAWTLVDTVAQTIYAVSIDRHLGQWFSAVVAALAVAGAFARHIATLVGSRRAGARPGPTFSTITWIAATVVVSAWLVLVTVGSYAIVWRFGPIAGKPEKLGAEVQPTRAAAGIALCTASAPTRGTGSAAAQPNWEYVGVAFSGLLLLSFMFGHTRTFANMSSLHAFYAARLTRTFLGGSNERRHEQSKPVTETIPGDDLSAEAYWRWPVDSDEEEGAHPRGVYPWTRGGPLHLVNVTVNETLDAVTGVQHADRKGTGMAIGPAGLSLGVRHHLITSGSSAIVRPLQPADGVRPHVYQAFARGTGVPEPLPLGRWVSISGAAFSTAAGAHTTVPSAILAGMFNVRLGYWWDSGTARKRRSTFAFAFPVQYALLSEALARTRGTADRLWNLSDGGHFENMGGYELIRRRLPIMVIVDAEADPDYVFAGLSDLVRKARLDFNAEVVFYNNRELSRHLPSGPSGPRLLPADVRPYFGDLDALRRGRWSGEPLPPAGEKEETRYSLEVNRTRVSRAHAALARVEYLDTGETSWLVYVKASLMGDEPEDVCHYHHAHPEFPQEPTTDQFFDEAQWESYRRLGQHIGHRVLTPELFDHLRALKPVPGSELVSPDDRPS